MLKAVELVEDKKNSTDFFYPKSCQVYLICTREDENLSTFAYRSFPPPPSPRFKHMLFKAVSWSVSPSQVSY